MNENTQIEPRTSERWTLIRDAAVLQFKLIVDGLRDFLLVPASLIAAFLSLATAKDGRPGPQFYRLLVAGKQSERWINLFGAHTHAAEDSAQDGRPGEMTIDELVVRVESFVVDEYKRGGVTAQAMARIDKALDAIQGRARNRS